MAEEIVATRILERMDEPSRAAFKLLGERIRSIESRLPTASPDMNQRMNEQIQSAVKAEEERSALLKDISSKQEGVKARLEALEKRFEGFNLESLCDYLRGQKARLEALEERITALESKDVPYATDPELAKRVDELYAKMDALPSVELKEPKPRSHKKKSE